MSRRLNKTRLISALVIIALLIVGIILFINDRLIHSGNKPYEPNTPPPAAHNGTFSCEYGTMTFNGDGKTVIIDFNDELVGLTGLPAGRHSGTYVFLSGDLPPNGSVEVRYDVAHELGISVEGVTKVIQLGIASADGKTAQIGVDTVTETRIPLLLKTEKGSLTAMFIKQ